MSRIVTLSRLGGFAALALLYSAWALCDTLTELGGDSATYMLMARALSPFVPADPMLAQALATATYPPLFPALIGLLGGGFAAAHALVVAALLLAFMLLYRLLLAQRLDAGLAAAAVALFAFLPGTYLLALNIWSENSYLAASLFTLLALERATAAPEASHPHWWWTAAVAAACAVMIRSAGLPLLGVVTLYATARRPRHWPWMVLVAWLPFIAWAGFTRGQGGGASQYTQQLVTEYAHAGFSHLREQLRVEGWSLVNAWNAGWLGFIAPALLRRLVVGFGLVCLAAWTLQLRRGRPDAVYCLLYLVMLLVWPWPGEAPRLLYAILPLLIGYGMQAVQVLAGQPGRRSAAIRVTFVAMLALVVLPGVLVTAQRRLAPVPEGLSVLRHVAGYYSDDVRQERRVAYAQAQILADLPRLAGEVPPGDCVYHIKPVVVELLAGRHSTTPPLPATDDRTFAQKITQCRYAYLMLLQSPTFPTAFYPRDRLGSQYHVLRQLPDESSRNGDLLAELIELQPAQP